MNFNRIPFLRLIIPLILGIISSLFVNIPVFYILIVLVFLSLSLLAFSYFPYLKTFKFSRFFGLSLILLAFFGGIYLEKIRQVEKVPIDSSKEQTYIARITETLEEKEKSVKTILEIEENVTNPNEAGNYAVITYFEKNEKLNNLRFNDRLLIKCRINKNTNNGNPYEFDYAAFLAKKGIFYQTYIKKENFEFLEHENSFSLLGTAQNIRNKLLNIYKFYRIEGRELAVLSALTLGYKSLLDRNTKAAFSESGAMHVLAVSGLHVGIILMVLNYIFKPFGESRAKRAVKAVVIITALWFFALITGLSPSVRRAATMFSIIAFGDFIDKRGNIYNSIWASAFILLIIDPTNFFDVGFQLSYSAVFAIVSMQPIIYKSLYVPTRLGKAVWSLLTVSIAAQLGTMPLTLLYFNQFPTYFMITNLFVIPLAFAIVISALALFTFSKISFIAAVIAFILNYFVKALNFGVDMVQSLPFSSIKGLELALYESLLFYLFLAFLFSYFAVKNKTYLKIAGILMLIISTSNFYGNIQKSKYSYFIVYNINKSSCINFANTTENIIFTDSSLVEDPLPVEFAVNSFQTVNNFPFVEQFHLNEKSKTDFKTFVKEENFFLYKENKIGVLNSSTQLSKPIRLNFLVLSKACKLSLEEILNSYKFEWLVIDSSVSFWQLKKWKEELSRLDISCHIVSEQGAFVFAKKN